MRWGKEKQVRSPVIRNTIAKPVATTVYWHFPNGSTGLFQLWMGLQGSILSPNISQHLQAAVGRDCQSIRREGLSNYINELNANHQIQEEWQLRRIGAWRLFTYKIKVNEAAGTGDGGIVWRFRRDKLACSWWSHSPIVGSAIRPGVSLN